MTEFGYPRCCTEWMQERLNTCNLEVSFLQYKYSRNLGFIPCKECCEKLEKNGMWIHELIDETKRSKDSKPFPIIKPYTDQEVYYDMQNPYRGKYIKSK